MPTSTTEIEDNIIDFHQRRREKVIRKIIETGDFPREQIENIIKMHEFLLQIDYGLRNNTMPDSKLEEIQEEIVVVREKFEELFEMTKDQLFIGGYRRT
tara:strand:+ start:167 stop:463 length:297 start_codon:yes stop_codon:yes gene_type:complete